jgi:hypothetical protein
MSWFRKGQKVLISQGGPFLNIYKYSPFRTDNILTKLCDGYAKNELSGDLCELVCSSPRNWSVIDFHQGASKRVLRINSNGTEYVLKSTKDFFHEFTDQLDPKIDEDEMTDKIVEMVNENTKLGYPLPYKKHLIKTLWQNYDLSRDIQLSNADRASLWTLMQQDEFIAFNLLPLSRVSFNILFSIIHAFHKVLDFRLLQKLLDLVDIFMLQKLFFPSI